MDPSNNDGNDRDENRTIGRKRPYEPSEDAAEGSEVENPSQEGSAFQSDTDYAAEASSARWSSNNNASSSLEREARSTQGSEARAPLPVMEALGAGAALQNPSYLVSASNSEANNNSSSEANPTSTTSAADGNPLASVAAASNPFLPLASALSPFGITQPAGLDQATLMANAVNQAALASQANLLGGTSPDLTNLYQLNLLQLMNSQAALRAQQGAINPGINALLAQQQALNPFLAGNLYSRLLAQQSLAPSMGTDALQLAGLMPGAASSASLPMVGLLGAEGAASLGSNVYAASLPGFGAPRTYRQPIRPTEGPILYMSSDDDILSDQQVLLRKQIELFAADNDDVNAVTPGRRKEIVLGQVGIRCRYCAHIPIHHRSKGAVYYPAKLKGIYQAAQNMAVSHFCDACDNIDPFLKAELRAYQQGKSTSGHGGKQYWADSAKVLGVIETEDSGLRFDPNRKANKKAGDTSDEGR